MKGCITVPEYGELRIGAAEAQGAPCITERHATALEGLSRRYGVKVFQRTGKSVVKATQHVGVVRVHGQLIEVLPKIDGLDEGGVRRNLVAMLARTRNLDIRDGELADLALQRDLLEVVIRLFATRLFEAVRGGLAHRYESRQENIGLLRGRLQVSQHVAINAAHPERFHCQFDEFQADHALNQALKAAVILLRSTSQDAENQRLLSELRFALDHVTTVAPQALAWNRILLDRTSRRFHGLVSLAKLFLQGTAQDVTSGMSEGFSLLFDMNALFEEYVGRCLLNAFKNSEIDIRLQGPSRHLLRELSSGKLAFLAMPDVVASRQDTPLWLLDTKWKRLDLAEPYAGVSQADIYQMLGYAQRYGVSEVVLLYPHFSALGQPGDLSSYAVLLPSGTDEEHLADVRIRICTLRLTTLSEVGPQLQSLLTQERPVEVLR